MRKPVVLITGASGEIGHGLITRLARNTARSIITLDVSPLAPDLGKSADVPVKPAWIDQRAAKCPSRPRSIKYLMMCRLICESPT